jgi:hypothetical protein
MLMEHINVLVLPTLREHAKDKGTRGTYFYSMNICCVYQALCHKLRMLYQKETEILHYQCTV